MVRGTGGAVRGGLIALAMLAASRGWGAPDAGAPWDGPAFSADPQALAQAVAARPPPPPEAPDLLLEEHRLVFDAQGRRAWTSRLVFVPPAREARSWATVHRAYGAWHQAPPKVRARVVSRTGEVRWLDPATLTDGVLPHRGEVFSDRRVLEGPLPAIEPGVVVEEEHQVDDTAPFFAAGTVTVLEADRGHVVGRLRIRIEAPAELPLKVVAWGLPAPREQRVGGRRILELEVADLPPAKETEVLLPPEKVTRRGLGLATGRSWAEVAEAYGAVADRQLEGADLAETARGLFIPGDDVRKAATRVLGWITDRTRYTGLSLGERGLVPARPSETLERRYGDCKDLSLLAVGLLRAGGYQASVVLVRTGAEDVDPGLPGLGEFDHAVVRVEGRQPVWLDPASDAPAGQLSLWAQGKLALVAGTGTQRLVRTPESAAAESGLTVLRRVELAEEGFGRSREETRAWGVHAAFLREEADEQPQAEREKRAGQRMAAVEASLVKVSPPPDAGAEAVVVSEVAPSRWSYTDDDGAEVVVAADPVFESLPQVLTQKAEGAPRVGPLRLPLPFTAHLTYRLLPPPGFSFLEGPSPDRFEIGPASFRASVTALPGGEVEVGYHFVAGPRYQPAEVAALRAAVTGRISKEPRVRFQRTSRMLLDAGRGREALTELRRLVAARPEQARPRLHLALALLGLGMGEAARAEARRAVALEPTSEWAHRALGLILQHDLLGRRYAEGADLPGALAELRLARQHAPRSALVRSLLAEALVTSEGGARMGFSARPEEALAELRFVHDELQEHRHDAAYARLLLATGQPQVAVEVARSAPAGEERAGVLLAAIQAVEGLPGLMRELRALPPSQAPVAIQRAMVELWQARAYPALAALFSQLSRQRAGAVTPEVAYTTELVARVRRAEELKGDRADPAQVPTLFLVAMASGDQAQQKRLTLEGEAAPPSLWGPGLALSLGGFLGQQAAGLSGRVALDMLLAQLQFSLEPGGPPWRARGVLRAAPAAPIHTPDLIFILVRGPQGPLVAAVNPEPPELGRLALRLAREGDQAGARALLGWARERFKATSQASADLEALLPAAGPVRPEAVETAAATLAARGRGQAVALPVLVAAWPRASGAARTAVGRALLASLRAEPSLSRRRQLAEEVAADQPTLAVPAAEARVAALLGEGRTDAARAALAGLAPLEKPLEALRHRASLEGVAGNYPAAAASLASALELKEADAEDWNNAAWNRLYLPGPVGADALEQAQKAAQLSEGKAWHILHTLATVQAFLGQPADAMASLGRALQARGGAVATADWLVVGRVAEAYGLLDEARAAYRRLPPLDGPTGASSWELAQARLKALEGVQPPPW